MRWSSRINCGEYPPRVPQNERPEIALRTLWFVHRRTVELTIPRQVVSPQSLPPFRQPGIILNRQSSQIHRTPESCLKKSNCSGTRIPARNSWQRIKNRKEFKICFESVVDQSKDRRLLVMSRFHSQGASISRPGVA